MNIQKIAELAGVSASTVSRVFNHSPKISKEVSLRVLEIAKKYNYHPRLTEKQRNVILLIPHESGYPAHYCVERLVIAISGELFKRNFNVEIMPWSGRQILQNKQFFPAAAIGLEPDIFDRWSDDFAQPLVVVDRKVKNTTAGIYQVASDEFGAMDMAVAHLKESGAKKIGCLIYGDRNSSNAKLRFSAAFTALENHGFEISSELGVYASEENFLSAVKQMLDLNVDALLCPGSSGGLLTAQALHQMGKKIPDDMSLISTEVAFYSPYATPPHTTLSPDYQAMAETVAGVFISHLEGNNSPGATEISYRLIKRASVRK